MRKKISLLLVGLIVIALGVGIIGNAVGAWNFKVFVDGWWALALMVVFLFMIINGRPNLFNVLGLVLFGFLFLKYHIEPLKNVNAWLVVAGAAVLFVGIRMIIRAVRPAARFTEASENDAGDDGVSSCAFSSCKTSYDGRNFHGGKFTCSFGSYSVDLRGATITKGAELKLDCAFGKIEVFVPEGTTATVTKGSFCGSVRSSLPSDDGADLKITADCAFGSINIS